MSLQELYDRHMEGVVAVSDAYWVQLLQCVVTSVKQVHTKNVAGLDLGLDSISISWPTHTRREPNVHLLAFRRPGKANKDLVMQDTVATARLTVRLVGAMTLKPD